MNIKIKATKARNGIVIKSSSPVQGTRLPPGACSLNMEFFEWCSDIMKTAYLGKIKWQYIKISYNLFFTIDIPIRIVNGYIKIRWCQHPSQGSKLRKSTSFPPSRMTATHQEKDQTFSFFITKPLT